MRQLPMQLQLAGPHTRTNVNGWHFSDDLFRRRDREMKKM
jgi:hypothetical protein